MTKLKILAVTVAATAMLSGCGGGGGNGTMPESGTPPSVAIGDQISGTVDSATDVDSFRLPIAEEGTLTITTAGTGNPSIRVLDAAGMEIPGQQGSYVVKITAVILDRGGYVTIEFYGGTVGQTYTATVEFTVSPVQNPPTTDDTPPMAKDAGQLLADGVRLPVRIAGVREAKEEGRTTPASFNFSIRRNASGQFVVVVANHEHTFADHELHQYGASHEEDPELTSDIDPDIWFSVQSTDMESLRSGHSEGDHYIAFRLGREIEEVDGSDPEYEGFAIVGVPTSDFTQRDVTATYNGFALLDLWQTQFEPKSDEFKERWTSRDATLTANFSDSTISGQINDLAPEDAADLGSFSLTMPETTFSADGFSGSFVVTAENAPDQLNVSFDGSFYGPNAENAAAVMRANGILTTLDGADSSSVVGAGSFGATEMDQGQ